MRRHRFVSRLVATCLMLGAAGFASAPAEACMIAPRPLTPAVAPLPVSQSAAHVLFARLGDEVTAHVQVQYYGEASAFSWIVPVEAAPTVGVGSDALFTALSSATRPEFRLTHRTEGACKDQPVAGGALRAPAKSAPQAGAPAAGVDVVAQKKVGPYDTVVLTAENPEALKSWLSENGYAVPEKLDPLVAGYVEKGYHFVALKLQQDRTTGDLQPITLRYKADKPGLPVRLASLSATPDMDVKIWVLGAHRAIPENYNLTEINQARIDWLSAGNNYRQVVTEAMNESGGKAFVTDYAGDSSRVALPPAHLEDMTVLQDKASYTAFIPTFLARTYFEESGLQGRNLAFLKRHAPKPESLAGLSDEAFYQDPGAYAAAIAEAGLTVDVAGAIRELEETVVAPKREIETIFRENPYLTAFYTTMSPDEMVEDPTFQFNPDMENVANVHTAEAVRECSPSVFAHEAPLKIKLEDGIAFYVSGQEPPKGNDPSEGRPVKIPAAKVVMKCGLVGQPQYVVNNGDSILRTLSNLARQGIAIHINTTPGANPGAGAGTSIVITAPGVAEFLSRTSTGLGNLGGFGCAGCAPASTPPVRSSHQGGEGLTFALFLMGALGYRQWLGRRG